MEKRYSALRTIATIYKVLGIIVIGIAILASLGSCIFSVMGGGIISQLDNQYGAGMGGFGIIGGILIGIVMLIAYGGLGLTLYAIGEGIYLFLAIEENTRATALLLQRQNQPMVH